jgi:hypothetical protein
MKVALLRLVVFTIRSITVPKAYARIKTHELRGSSAQDYTWRESGSDLRRIRAILDQGCVIAYLGYIGGRFHVASYTRHEWSLSRDVRVEVGLTPCLILNRP